MFRLIFFLPAFFLLQNSVARPPTTTTELEGIFFEYNPPPRKSDTELFTAILEPTMGINASVAQFMQHLKHTTYASAFMTEVFTLGKGIHLFTNDIMRNPSDEDRRIAFAIGKSWTTLTCMEAIDLLVLRISNETSLRYLRNEDKNGTIKFLFSKLNDSILADSTLNQTYAEEMRNLDDSSLPPLVFAKINLRKLITIEEMLREKVWSNSTSFDLIAHARFAQHLETKIPDAPKEDYENILMAHVLKDAASTTAFRGMAQKVYDEAITKMVKENVQVLPKTKVYYEFDSALFTTINNILSRPEYSKLEKKLAKLRENYPPIPVPE